MMRSKLLILLCALGLMAVGCTIHEVPEGGDEAAAVALSLEIYLDEDMPQFSRITVSTKSWAPQARYIVRFFPIVGDHYIKDAPFEFTATEDDLTDRRYVLDVPPMNYHMEVWADWLEGSAALHNAADFGSVTINTDPYTGGVATRDAFCGAKDIDLSGYTANNSIATASITLTRPIARYTFISTDKDEFINYWASEVAMDNGTNVKDPDAVDLSSFRVVVSYPQYMPSVYNLHEGIVADSATGVSFEAKLTELADGTVQVAWDYVLAQDETASVVVSLAIYSDTGKLITYLDGIQIPVAPGHETIVTGKLLTSAIHHGVIIDPSFDGEYEIHI